MFREVFATHSSEMFTISLRYLVFTIFISYTSARYCIHDQKGHCQGHNLWGWCFHNKTSGQFNCDDDAFCVSQDQLKNKKSSGCFIRENSTVCCCNDADGCNLGFIAVQPKYAHGQSCQNVIEAPNEEVRPFKPCDDPYCYSILSADADGGPSTAIRGCHSRKLVMHYMSKHEDEKYNNNTKWKETEQLAKLPNCAEVLRDQPKFNGTTQLCVDFLFEQEDEEGEKLNMKGRMCCCAGTGKCNEKQGWSDEGIKLAELEEIIEKRKSQTSDASHLANSLPSSILIFVFFTSRLVLF